MRRKKRKLRGLSLNNHPFLTEEEKVSISCPTCGLDLTKYIVSQRDVHVNECLDQQVETQTKIEKCKICDGTLNELDTLARIRHFKQCGKKYGVTAVDVLSQETLSPPVDENRVPPIQEINSFDVLMSTAKLSTASAAASIENARSCPAYKKIQGSNPPIIVDGFQYASKRLSNVYVLSHFHSDHYTGLSKSFNAGVIFCTEITAKLVQLKLSISKEYLHPVQLNKAFMLPNRVEMMFLDANHCPGAAVIRFKLPNGKLILHTGDFRFNSTLKDQLKSVLQPKLHTVYLDTTYCQPRYQFPKQERVIQAVLETIEQTVHDNKVLYLFGTYSIGKERVFLQVAQHFNQKVYLEPSKYRMMELCLQKHEMKYMTREIQAANFHVVPMGFLNFDKMSQMLQERRLRYRKIVAFRPTGWCFSKKSILSTRANDARTLLIHGVPYSEHSSFHELCDFIQTFRPASIIPTVNCSTSPQQVALLKTHAQRSIRTFFT